MEIERLFDGPLAQSYLFHPRNEEAVFSMLEKIGISIAGNPNVVVYKKDSFQIEDSREIKEIANMKAGEEDTFIFITTDSITTEAQHALLKTLEEPGERIHFFLFFPNHGLLLPTLLSRCIVFSNHAELKNLYDGKNFLDITLHDRIAAIEKLTKETKKEDPQLFKEVATQIFDSVILKLRETLTPATANDLESILSLRSFLSDRGSSPKQLLEALAVQLEK